MLKCFIFTCLFMSVASHAEGQYKYRHHHDHECAGCGHSHEVTIDESSDPNKVAEALLTEAHELNHDHSKKTAKGWIAAWVKQFQMIRSVRNFDQWRDWRTYHSPQFSDHISNVVLLFGASHLMEMASGPVMAGVGSAVGLPDMVNVGILGVGAVISVPGLDPVCIGLAALYKAKPGFRTGVTKIRMSITRAIKGLANGIGLKWKSGEDRLRAIGSEEDGEVAIVSGDLRLEFQKRNDKFFLHSMTSNPATVVADLSTLSRSLDSNTRSVIKEVVRGSARRPFYIESMETGLDGNQIVEFKSGAVQPWGRLGCADWLQP